MESHLIFRLAVMAAALLVAHMPAAVQALVLAVPVLEQETQAVAVVRKLAERRRNVSVV